MTGYDEARARYAAYLQSEHWQTVREEALERAEYRCQLCYSPDELEVHHRTYERLGAERPMDLTVLCAGCHQRHHRIVTARQILLDVWLAPRPAPPPRVSLLDLARGRVPPTE